MLCPKNSRCSFYGVLRDSMLLESCKDSAKVVPRPFWCRAGNEEVVQISIAEVQDLVVELLESLCFIVET